MIRLKIIDSLFKTRSCEFSYANLINADTKKGLIDDNKELINSLISWPIRFAKTDK